MNTLLFIGGLGMSEILLIALVVLLFSEGKNTGAYERLRQRCTFF